MLSGLNEQGQTCGAPLCAVIENQDARSQDYDKLRVTPRPRPCGLSRFRAGRRGANDLRAVGANSPDGLTAPLCLAGAVCMQLLARKGVEVGARIAAIAGLEGRADRFGPGGRGDRLPHFAARTSRFGMTGAGERMRQAIEQAHAEMDSVGGIIEAWAVGVPAGSWGSHV